MHPRQLPEVASARADADLRVLHLQIDETEMYVSKTHRPQRPTQQGSKPPKARVVSVFASLVMIHAMMFEFFGQVAGRTLDLICTPALLAKKTAECQFSAIQKLLPLPLTEIAKRSQLLVLGLTTDATLSWCVASGCPWHVVVAFCVSHAPSFVGHKCYAAAPRSGVAFVLQH